MMNGMSREATQKMGGWTSPTVMGAAHNKTRCEEVAPEMRAAVSRACAVPDVTFVVEGLDREACADVDEILGAEKSSVARLWFRRFFSLQEYFAPICENFWSLTGRRVRHLNLFGSQRRGSSSG